MKYQNYDIDQFLQDESFQAYALGLDAKQVAFWNQWIQENPEMQDKVEQAASVLNSFSINSVTVDAGKFDQDLSKVKSMVAQSGTAKTIAMPSRFSMVYKVAAAILLMIGIGWYSQQFVNVEQEMQSVTLLEKSNPKGRKSTVTLPDGSVVKLNAESYLKYEEVNNQRKVYLKGEAFFKVKKDRKRPFTVYSSGVSTTALGTSFNVKAYPEDDIAEVYLVTGKVEIKNIKNRKDPSLVLEPGRGMIYSKSDREMTKTNPGSEHILAWSKGVIQFENADLKKVRLEVERWFGVDVKVIGSPTDKWKVNGSFERQSLENVLKSIQYTTPFEYTISGKDVTIKF